MNTHLTRDEQTSLPAYRACFPVAKKRWPTVHTPDTRRSDFPRGLSRMIVSSLKIKWPRSELATHTRRTDFSPGLPRRSVSSLKIRCPSVHTPQARRTDFFPGLLRMIVSPLKIKWPSSGRAPYARRTNFPPVLSARLFCILRMTPQSHV